MEEKKKEILHLGAIKLYGDGSDLQKDLLPKIKVLKASKKNNGIIEVKRTMRTGVHYLKPGESVDWNSLYN